MQSDQFITTRLTPPQAEQLDNYLLHSIGICSLTCSLNIYEPASWEMKEAAMALLRVLLA